jgi:hypothetical protein
MITGREALFAIEKAISRVRRDEHGLDEALRSAMAGAQRLRHDMAEGFRTLACARLDALACDQVTGDLDASERQALAVLEGRQREIDALSKKRDEAQAALDDAEAEKHERDQKLADALDAIDELYDRATERMKADSHWHDAKAAVATAVDDAQCADKKAADAEADRARESKPYENDPLFMYLWNKHARHGGNGAGAIGSLFGRLIERFAGYHEARARYELLREVPIVLREQARNKAHDIDTARAQVAALEHQALVSDGLDALEARAESAHEAVVSAEQNVATITADLGKIEAKRQWIIEADDKKSERRAVDLLAQALEREDLQRLYRDAITTQTSADDQAVSAISSAQTALQKADGDVLRIRNHLREMARRRSELEGARDRARSVGYDDPRARFVGEGDAIGDVIGGILSGAIRGAALDRILRDNFRAPKGRADPGFGRWEGASSLLHPRGQGGAPTPSSPSNGWWRPHAGP